MYTCNNLSVETEKINTVNKQAQWSENRQASQIKVNLKLQLPKVKGGGMMNVNKAVNPSECEFRC